MKNLIYKKILNNLLLIRKTEKLIANKYNEGNLRCPVHLSIGQEGISAPINLVFNDEDLAVSSHRAHAHYIGKGGNIKNLFAEIMGNEGCSGGIGGSMHLTDKKRGFVMSTAIVANSIPIGVGLSMSQKYEYKKNITLIFFGEGATEQGVFYESINFAALKNLPCLFICEDNLYSVYSNLKTRQPKRNILEIVKKMGINGLSGDGNNPLKVFKYYQKAKKFINTNKKPFFLDLKTYRYLEHCGPFADDHLGYRSKKELISWKKKDPVENFKSFLINRKVISLNNLTKIEHNIEKKINKFYKLAQNYPKPKYSKIKNFIFNERKNII